MIKRPGHERRHVEIPDAEVAATVEQFQAIRGDWEKFKAFVDAVPAVSP